ncbi:hypothetical protein [Mucilaginibacter sp.]|jgi:hypothetical protein|nr:hypothetical protein [Mucilaginibacter sp.]HTI57957.1 hypothetical protein [Mucilaginibacter sp.]
MKPVSQGLTNKEADVVVQVRTLDGLLLLSWRGVIGVTKVCD